MQLYKIKLLEGHTAKRDEIFGEHLESYGYEGELLLFNRSEALKKAIAVGGKIEKHGKNYTTSLAKILQLAKSQLGDDVINELRGREVYTDDDNPIYFGDVFEAILCEDAERPLSKRMSFTTSEDINVLNTISLKYQYIMLL